MKKELLTYQDPKSPVSEVFRTLRTNIQFMNTDKKLRTILVTSTFPGEGKSWVTSNLAVTFAQAGKRVILIDADMRKGRQYKILDVVPKPGLSNYLSNMDANNMETAEEVHIESYIQSTDVENLHVIVAGNVPPNPSELLVSSRMRHLLKDLKEMYDIIIIDGTPCDLVTDSIILSRFVDSTIIVTAQKETKKDSLTRIVKNIQNVGGKIAGVVVNKVDISAKKYNESYYYGSISGGNVKKHSKHDKKSGVLSFDKLLNFAQEDEEDDNNQDYNIDKAYEKLYGDLSYSSDDVIKESQELMEKLKQDNEENNVENEIEQYVDETIDNEAKLEEKEYTPNNNNNRNKNKKKKKHKNNNRNINQQNIENHNEEFSTENSADTVERAESAKNISDDKAKEIINLVNDYIKSEQDKQERKN